MQYNKLAWNANFRQYPKTNVSEYLQYIQNRGMAIGKLGSGYEGSGLFWPISWGELIQPKRDELFRPWVILASVMIAFEISI